MIVKCYTEPTLEPVILAELKLASGIDSGTFDGNLTLTQCLAYGSHAIANNYTVHVGTGVDVLGKQAEVLLHCGANNPPGSVTSLTIADSSCTESNGTYNLIFTGANTTPATGTYTILTSVITAVTLTSGGTGYVTAPTVATQGGDGSVTASMAATNDTKIQECDTFAGTYTDWATGAFTQVTNATDNADFKKVYTGPKKYIRTASKVLLAACEFGTSILTNAPMVSDDAELNELISNGRLSVENDTNKKIMQQTWDYRPQSWPSGDRLKIPFGNLWSLLSLTIVDSSCTETDGIYALKFTGANTTPATGTYTIVSSVITATTITGGGVGYVTAPTVATQSGDGSVTAALASVTWKDTAGTVTTLTVGTDYLVESNGDQCGFIVLPYQGSWPSGELYPSNPISIRFVCGWATQAEVPVTFKQAVKRHAINSYANKGDDTVGAMITYDTTYRSQINLCGVLYDMDFL